MQDVTKDRAKWIGGSDVPAIMGISPFKKRFRLLQEKAEIVDQEFFGNEYTEYGNVMEPKIRDYVNKLYNTEFKETKHENPANHIRYHADGDDGELILEIKTTSQIHESLDDYKVYLVQLLTGISEYGYKGGILAVYERPSDFSEEFDESRLHIYDVHAENYLGLIERIYASIEQFLNDLEKLRENPLIGEEDIIPSEIVNYANPIIEMEQAMITYKEMEKRYKEMKDGLKKAMEKYNIKSWTTEGGIKITLIPDGASKTERVFDEKSFAEERPDEYEAYMVEKTKKGRKGHVRITL